MLRSTVVLEAIVILTVLDACKGLMIIYQDKKNVEKMRRRDDGPNPWRVSALEDRATQNGPRPSLHRCSSVRIRLVSSAPGTLTCFEAETISVFGSSTQNGTVQVGLNDLKVTVYAVCIFLLIISIPLHQLFAIR